VNTTHLFAALNAVKLLQNDPRYYNYRLSILCTDTDYYNHRLSKLCTNTDY